MSDSADALRRKITSAEDLQTVVRAMRALAASSIQQYRKSMLSVTDYETTVMLGLGACLRAEHRLAAQAPATKKPQKDAVGAIVFGSDQGLVGQFNDVIGDYAKKTLAALGVKAEIWAVGERIYSQLVDSLAESQLEVVGQFSVPGSIEAVSPLVGQILVQSQARRLKGHYKRVYVFYNQLKSGELYDPVGYQLLPLDEAWREERLKLTWPTRQLPQIFGEGLTTLRALIREYLFVSLFRACTESLASENASRLAAMARADQNISDLLKTLSSTSERLRQSAIDEELFDVVSSFEALGN